MRKIYFEIELCLVLLTAVHISKDVTVGRSRLVATARLRISGSLLLVRPGHEMSLGATGRLRNKSSCVRAESDGRLWIGLLRRN